MMGLKNSIIKIAICIAFLHLEALSLSTITVYGPYRPLGLATEFK
jgi:hypothetical protein